MNRNNESFKRCDKTRWIGNSFRELSNNLLINRMQKKKKQRFINLKSLIVFDFILFAEEQE